MLRSVHRRSIGGGLFACFIGFAFVSIGIYWIAQHEFRLGKHPSTLVTPEFHPVFFWAWLLGQIAVGSFVIFRGVVDIRYCLRQRKQARSCDHAA